jgi:hypothetical protein
MNNGKWQPDQDLTAASPRPSGEKIAQARPNIQRVKSAEYVEHLVEPMYGTYLSSITEEDVKRIREYSKKLQADDKARKEFFIRVGLYNKDGSVAEPFRHLFEES